MRGALRRKGHDNLGRVKGMATAIPMIPLPRQARNTSVFDTRHEYSRSILANIEAPKKRL